MFSELEALMQQHRGAAVQRIRVGAAGLCMVAVASWATVQNAVEPESVQARPEAPMHRPPMVTEPRPDTPIMIEPARPDRGDSVTVMTRESDDDDDDGGPSSAPKGSGKQSPPKSDDTAPQPDNQPDTGSGGGDHGSGNGSSGGSGSEHSGGRSDAKASNADDHKPQ